MTTTNENGQVKTIGQVLSPGEIWDRAACQRLTESMTASASGLKPLRLHTEPDHKYRPTVPRAVGDIDTNLRAKIRGLVMGELRWPLFVHGPAGTGKTCAALCLLDYAGGMYFTTCGLAETRTQVQQGRLEYYHESRGGIMSTERWWRDIRRAPLFVLDELGARDRVSDHVYETAYLCIDERGGLPLVVLSNWGLEKIAQLFDDRVASRLSKGTVVELTGQDRRLAP